MSCSNKKKAPSYNPCLPRLRGPSDFKLGFLPVIVDSVKYVEFVQIGAPYAVVWVDLGSTLSDWVTLSEEQEKLSIEKYKPPLNGERLYTKYIN